MAERRKFSPEYKVRVVLEMLKGEKSLMQASRDYGIKDTVLSRWKQEFLERSPEVFRQRGTEEQREMAEKIAELERMVGRLTLELDTAKKVLGISSSAKRNGGDW
jgi:transposase